MTEKNDMSAQAIAGWTIVFIAFVGLALSFAARSSVSFVMPIWETELGWSRSLSSAGSSLVLALMAVSSPLAGNLMDRFGPRYVLGGGLLIVGMSVGVTGIISEEWQYLLIFGVLGGVGYGAVSLPLTATLVATYFTKMRGIATGIAMSGATGGQLIVLPVLALLVAGLGWRGAFGVFGLILLALAPIAVLLIRRRPPQLDEMRNEAPRAADGLWDRLGFLARNRTFLLLLGAFTLCGFTTAGVIDVHLVSYAISCGFDRVDSSAAYGFHGVTNMAGLILFGWLADRVHRPRLLATMFFVRAVTFVLLMYIAADISLLFIFAGIFGLLNFATLPVIANIVASHIGVRIMGLTLGLLFGGHSLGAAIGAYFGGVIYDLHARYDWVWLISIGVATLAGVCAMLIEERRDGRGQYAPAAA